MSVLTIPSECASGPDVGVTVWGFVGAACVLPETRCVSRDLPACTSDDSTAFLCRDALRINTAKEVHSKGVGKVLPA